MMKEKLTKLDSLMMKRIMIGVFVFAVIFRLGLAVLMPVKIYMQAGYDDALSINQALTILDGKWLGDYGTGTLTKGLSFTFFLLVNHFSHLSYPLFLCLVNIGAAFAMIKALAPLIKNKYLSGLGFLFLIYSPATLTSDFSLRVYRNSLVFAAVLAVLAGILGLYLRRKETIKKKNPLVDFIDACFSVFLVSARRLHLVIAALYCSNDLYILWNDCTEPATGHVHERRPTHFLAFTEENE